MNASNHSRDENAYSPPMTSGAEKPAAKKKKSVPVLGIAIGIVVLFMLIGMLLPSVSTPGHVTRRTQCLYTSRQIALAMINYESANGHFVPAYIADENGKPMHSWRVLLLPYLEETALYQKYSMDEPWDGPNNSKLHDETVPIFRCSSSKSDETCTDYVLITGEGTGFEGDQTISWADITDGSSNTILVTEIAGSDIHWMKPQDISPEEFLAIESNGGEMATNHSGSRNIALFDGSTHSISTESDPAELKKLITIAGGEIVNVLDL